MPIVIQCKCGKRSKVMDALGGRTIKCSGCGGNVLVKAATGPAPAPPPGGRAAAPAAAKQKQNANAAPAIAVSPTIVIGGAIGVGLLAVVLALYFGPWRVGSEWAAMSPRANATVTDVVMFALQAHQSQFLADDASPGSALARAESVGMGRAPAIEGDAVFVPPMMAFQMPRRIIVSGSTSQGHYIGTYDTTNGEVTVDVDVGGSTVGGLVDLKHPTGRIHVTGREKDGQVTAEGDGEPLKIIVPKYRGRHGELGG